jgi:transcriptional adapter 2-alpha
MSGESAGLSLPDSFLCTGGKNTQFRCSYCELDLSGGKLRFRCAECENFELCQDCFASGAKLYPHEPTHKYLVSDCLDASIFGKDWSIGEELLLLEGVERFGPGNWKVISEYIGTKSAAACDHHYWETYMGIFGRCLPSKTVLASGEDVSTDDILTGRASGASGAASSSSNGVGSNDAIIDDDKKSDLITKTKDSDKTASTLDVSTAPPLNSSSNSRSNKSSGSSSYGSSSSSGSYCADSTSSSGAGGGLSGDKPRIDDTIDIHVPNVSRGEKVVRSERVGAGTSKDKSKDTADVRQKLGAMVGADLPGFMPLREDFEVEWDNEAENILKYMDFDPADHPSERELKLQVRAHAFCYAPTLHLPTPPACHVYSDPRMPPFSIIYTLLSSPISHLTSTTTTTTTFPPIHHYRCSVFTTTASVAAKRRNGSP